MWPGCLSDLRTRSSAVLKRSGSERLDQVVECLQLDRGHGILAVRGREDDERLVCAALEHLESAHPRQLDVEENQVGLQLMEATGEPFFVRYWDLNARVTQRLSPRDLLSFLFVGAIDNWGFNLETPDDRYNAALMAVNDDQ
jgi:hypothetical protein